MSYWGKAARMGVAAGAGTVAISNGGTGATTADTALDNLGGTATGKAVFKASTAAAALTALGTKCLLTLQGIELDGTDVYRVVSPVAGTLSKIYSVIDGALTTGNATLTTKINSTSVTNGVVTITESGSAAGDVDSATPSGNHTVVAGDVISVTVGGTNDAAKTAAVTFMITQ